MRLLSTDHLLGMRASYIAANHQLHGADAFYVAVAAELNIPLVSWDNQQINRVSGLIRAYTPDQDR